MTQMPNADQCHVTESKIRDYLLNVQHKDGASKAKFFAALGFRTEGWQMLQAALQQHPIKNKLAARSASGYGTKYVVACALDTPNARNPCIVTVWMDDGNVAPRLVTAYPMAAR